MLDGVQPLVNLSRIILFKMQGLPFYTQEDSKIGRPMTKKHDLGDMHDMHDKKMESFKTESVPQRPLLHF